ncbi:MAG: hypothetical protein ACR2KT_06450 [Methylocella sp.]|nr:MAG: hypothetical protein DLM68_02705 [Hyphomicrobiales bacterium]
MALPKPIPGLVIRYSYLWYSEHLQGHDEGQKGRPCAIVATIREDESSDTRVLMLPLTPSPPVHASLAVEIPPKVKQRLQLDDARSWVVLSEWKEFIWSGPDLRRVPGADDSSVAYGMLPPKLFMQIRDRLVALIQSHEARPVRRT